LIFDSEFNSDLQFHDIFYEAIKATDIFYKVKRINKLNTYFITSTNVLREEDVRSNKKVKNVNEDACNYIKIFKKHFNAAVAFKNQGRTEGPPAPKGRGDLMGLVKYLYAAYCVGETRDGGKFGKTLLKISKVIGRTEGPPAPKGRGVNNNGTSKTVEMKNLADHDSAFVLSLDKDFYSHEDIEKFGPGRGNLLKIS